MIDVALDGFVFRFPRTGIVNYAFNVAQQLSSDPDVNLTLLLEDMQFTDDEIAGFVAATPSRIVPHLPELPFDRLMARWRREDRLAARLPSPREISRAVAIGEVYHATDWYHYAVPAARRNVITCFDLTAKLYPQYHERTNIVKEERKGAALRDFDHVVAISESTRRDAIEHFQVPEDRISTSYLGIDEVYRNPHYEPRESFMARYGVDPGRRYLLSVCTIEPRKNIIGMLNAYRLMCEDHPALRDVLLILSGPSGWRNESLSMFLADYPYRHNLVFPGYVPLMDMPSLYHHASGFVYLSFYEGFGIPILEAMSSVCPVVTSNVSSMPEVLGDCGILVSPDDPAEAGQALAELLENDAAADTMRFAGFARAQEFSWQRHATDLIRIYGNI